MMTATARRAATLALACSLIGTVLLFSQMYYTCFPAPKLLALTGLTAFAGATAMTARLSLPHGCPFTWPALATVAWAALGLRRTESPEAFTLVFLPLAGAAAAGWLAAGLGAHAAERSRLLAAFVLAHLGCGLYAIIQYFELETLMWGMLHQAVGWAGFADWTPWTLDYGRGRVFSTIGNPNFLAGQMVLAVPVLAVLGCTCSGGLRWLARVACATGLLAFIYAQTRGAWIGLLAGAAVAAAIWWRTPRPIRLPIRAGAWLIAVCMVLGLWYSIPSLNRTGISLPTQFASITDLNQQSARQRFFWWRGALELFRDAPLIGHGTGNFARQFPARSRRIAAPFSDLYPAFCDHPHNDYLFILCEHGILGLGLLLWLGAVWLKICAREASRGSMLHLGVLAGIVGVAVHGIWNMPSVIQATVLSAGCLLGLTGIPNSPGRAPAEPAVAARGPRWHLLVLGAGLAVALALTYRPAVLITAQAYLNGARILKQERRYAPAAYLARQTLMITNAPWRTSFMLGGIMYGQGLYQEALKYFEEDERENPWGADALLHQAKAHRELAKQLQRAGSAEEAVGRYHQADTQCRRALRLVPNYPEAAVTIASLAYFRANAARQAGRQDKMRRHLRHARVWLNYALAFFPRNAEALKLHGFVEVMDEQWVPARDAWERYIKVRPGDSNMDHRLRSLQADLPRLLQGGKPK